MSEMQKAGDTIAHLAAMAMRMTGGSEHEAILLAASSMIERGHRARLRVNEYRTETTSEELEEVFFLASFARDVMEGVHRPTVGDTYDYVLNAMRKGD